MHPRRLLIALYTASGAAALVYEVVWTRLLTLQLGHTVAAASTVLAAFMGGLAVGAWIAGRFITQDGARWLQPSGPGRLLRFYAALEIAIAVCALALPFALRATVPVLAWAYADGAAPTRFALLRVVISLTLVGIPAAAMGATFPIAAAWSAARSSAAALYAANTLGAAMGATAAGFWLIPALGLRATTWVGVALNFVAALGALWLATKATAEHTELAEPRKAGSKPKKTLRAPRPQRLPEPPRPALAAFAVAVSGFSALVYEVAWTRLLALVIGPTTYAFSTMAAAFVTGLAIGSALGTPLARQA